MFPGWINNDTPVLLRQKKCLREGRQERLLIIASEDGSKKKNAQPAIDSVATE
jgi:hypothetical protein